MIDTNSSSKSVWFYKLWSNTFYHFLRCHFTQVNMVWRPADIVSHVVLDAVHWPLGHYIWQFDHLFTFAFHMPSTALGLWQCLNPIQIILCGTILAMLHMLCHGTFQEIHSPALATRNSVGTDPQIYIYLCHFSHSHRWMVQLYNFPCK